jgi:hypothetical protein
VRQGDLMKNIREFFYTTVRKVEPVSGDCVRIYCSIERDGEWEDRVTLVVPIVQLLKNVQFVTESAREIFNEGKPSIFIEQVH